MLRDEHDLQTMVCTCAAGPGSGGLSEREPRGCRHAGRTAPAAGTRTASACILYLYRQFTPRLVSRLRIAHPKTTKVKIAHHDSARCTASFRRTIAANTVLIIRLNVEWAPACSAPRGWQSGARRATWQSLRYFCVTYQLIYRRGARARDVSGKSRAAGRRRDGVHHAARVHAGDDRL